MIRLMVGLGNLGAQYEATRHNAGFWWVNAVAAQLHAQLAPERSCHGLVARVNRSDGPVWLLQPATYMNLSGKSVAALSRFFKIEAGDILVAHDELDLQPGQIKIKRGGGDSGHNGLKDVTAQLGQAGYWRLRLGIGHPGVKAEVADYVLRRPMLEQREAIEQCINQSLTALDLILAGDMQTAMANIHAKPQRPKLAQQTGAVDPNLPETHE